MLTGPLKRAFKLLAMVQEDLTQRSLFIEELHGWLQQEEFSRGKEALLMAKYTHVYRERLRAALPSTPWPMKKT
jgi:hypothetical protein